MTKYVYIAWHSYELGLCEETKMIGVYSTHREADAAIERVKDQEGFRDHLNGFEVSRCPVGQDHWTDGFVTYTYPTNKISDA